jgi:hypothetical protein
MSLASCVTRQQFAENRIARILKRNPSLIKTDTVWKKDTIYTVGASKDSTFSFFQRDTVVLTKDNLTVKYFFNHDSTVYISGKCAPDTIIKMYPVQVNSVSVKEALTFWQKVKLWLWDNAWWVAILIYFIWKVFGKVLKTYFPFLNFLG